MLFKKRWIYKSLSWKLISAITGALVVLGLTGEYTTSWAYLGIYVPITLVLFVGHEYCWQVVKLRRRERNSK
jgi:phosphatidylglycerophosphate synthase